MGRTTFTIDYAKYPFLVRPADYIRSRYGRSISLTDIIRVRESRALKRAIERIRQAILEGEVKEAEAPLTAEDEILGYHLSIVLVSLTGDRWLARRYAEAEGKRVESLLAREDVETLAAIGRRLGVRVEVPDEPYKIPSRIVRGERIAYERLEVTVPFTDYLKAKRLLNEHAWRLENQVVEGGKVYLTRRRTARLLAEILTDTIESSIVFVREVPENLKSVVEEIHGLIEKYRGPSRAEGRAERIELEEVGGHPELFPPCIQKLYSDAQRGVSLPHHGRFALATFLLRVGADVEFVVNAFSKMPDFNEGKTRYQVEHLAGVKGSKKKYLTYSCDTMRTLGLCVEDCRSKNPLVVYLRNYRRAKRTRKLSSRNP